jgi:hypothetical protein
MLGDDGFDQIGKVFLCVDEARVGQQGTLTRVWAERGSRPAAPRDQAS